MPKQTNNFYREEELLKNLTENPTKDGFQEFKTKVQNGEISYLELYIYLNKEHPNYKEKTNPHEYIENINIDEKNNDFLSEMQNVMFYNFVNKLTTPEELREIQQDLKEELYIQRNSLVKYDTSSIPIQAESKIRTYYNNKSLVKDLVNILTTGDSSKTTFATEQFKELIDQLSTEELFRLFANNLQNTLPLKETMPYEELKENYFLFIKGLVDEKTFENMQYIIDVNEDRLRYSLSLNTNNIFNPKLIIGEEPFKKDYFREEELLKSIIENPTKENFAKFEKKVQAGEVCYLELKEYLNQHNPITLNAKYRNSLTTEQKDYLFEAENLLFDNLMGKMVSKEKLVEIQKDVEKEDEICLSSQNRSKCLINGDVISEIKHYYNEKLKNKLVNIDKDKRLNPQHRREKE